MRLYEVTVGNVGTVYSGYDRKEAEFHLEDSAGAIRNELGWRAEFPVILWEDGEPVEEVME